MTDHRRAICTCCGRHRDEVGELSWTGLCANCWPAILEENVMGIHRKSGMPHRRRLRGIAKYLERAMLDEQRKTA